MRIYSAVHTQFWNNPDIRGMSDDGRLLALYLLTCPHGNMIGCFLCPDGYIADGLQWPVEKVAKTVTETVSRRFTARFRDGRHIVICNYLKWNPIANPSMGRGAITAALQMPLGDPAFQHVLKGLELYANRLGDGLDTVRQRSTQQSRDIYIDTDTDTDQDQDQEGSVNPKEGLTGVPPLSSNGAGIQPEVTAPPEPPKPPPEPVRKDPGDPWVEVYARGKQVLGRSAGGIITNLRKLYDDKPRKVLNKIEDAAEQRDPPSWINGFLLKVDDGGRLSGCVIGAVAPP